MINEPEELKAESLKVIVLRRAMPSTQSSANDKLKYAFIAKLSVISYRLSGVRCRTLGFKPPVSSFKVPVSPLDCSTC